MDVLTTLRFWPPVKQWLLVAGFGRALTPTSPFLAAEASSRPNRRAASPESTQYEEKLRGHQRRALWARNTHSQLRLENDLVQIRHSGRNRQSQSYKSI
jgi:hypothetical protein